MSKEKATEDELSILHADVAEGLSKLIKSGKATGSDYANAIKFLDRNGIDCDLSVAGAPGSNLAKDIQDAVDADDGSVVPIRKKPVGEK